MKILITGCLGYLGSHVSAQLLQRGHELVGVDLGIFREPTAEEASWVRITDIRQVYWTPLLQGVEAIIHLASVSNDPAAELDPVLSWQINHQATRRLLAAAERCAVKHVLLGSTASVYGHSPDLCTETAPCRPQSLYAETKLAAERQCWASSVPTGILRLGTLFGVSPRMRFDLALNRMVREALTTGIIPVWGGQQWRPFLQVQDAARCLIKAVEEHWTGRMNVAVENVQIGSLALRVAYGLRQLRTIAVQQHPEDVDTRDYRMECLAMLHWGFQPSHTIDAGIQEVAEWIRARQQAQVSLDDETFDTVARWKRWLTQPS